MGNAVSWLAQWFYPDDQVFWIAVYYGDVTTIRVAALRLTPETRKYLEWQEPSTGRTPLLEAAAKGYCECARYLIEAGAGCNATDLRMNTPLHLACKRGQVKMVKLLLEVPAVKPFEINWRMKTPLDLARSRYLEEEEADSAGMYAECVKILEKKTCLYSGLLYKKVDNVLSLVSGISSLNSWTRRFCMVLDRGDPSVLELALFRIKKCNGVRPVCPTFVMLYNVAYGMKPVSDPRWFSPKDFTFFVRGDQLNKCHYRTSSTLQNPMYFAAIDHASYDAWRIFFVDQQKRLTDRRHLNASGHYNSAGWNPRPMMPNAGLLRPPLPVSAPDWDDQNEEDNELLGHAVERKECRTETKVSCVSNQNMQRVHGGKKPAHCSIGECVICFDGPQSAVCVPCGHNAVCMKCAEAIQVSTTECPVCRAHVSEFIKLYRV